MCGIIGIFNSKQAKLQVAQALKILKNRGKDASNQLQINETSEIGHTLHAVINHVPQPIKNQGILTANCEIYNWEELNKKHNLQAKNDADLLLKFLDTNQSLDELDGVYAFAYLGNNKLHLVRDIIGIKPIWYSYNQEEFAFASEKKALEKMGYLDCVELNPRQILTYENNKITLSGSCVANFLARLMDPDIVFTMLL